MNDDIKVADGEDITKKGLSNFDIQKNRDWAMLVALADGPMLATQIHSEFFKKPDGTLLPRQNLWERLRKLKEAGYIIQTTYSSIGRPRPLTAVMLDERGVVEVCNKFRIDPETVIVNFPHNGVLTHELFVASIKRTIRRDAGSKYDLVNMYNELMLKRQHQMTLHESRIGMASWEVKKNLRNYYIPDICVEVMPHIGNNMQRYFIEMDAGGKPAKYVQSKVSSWNDTITIVLTLNQDRLNKVIQSVSQSGRTQVTLFALVGDFIKKGLSDTSFILWPSDRHGTYVKLKL